MIFKIKNSITHSKFLSLSVCIFLLAILFSPLLKAQGSGWVVNSSVSIIDGSITPYNNVQPGDTVFLQAGNRDKLQIRNFKGSPIRPIIFMNKGTVVNISTNDYYGISILNCRYIRFTGQGNSTEFYGIQIKKVAAGAGIGVGSLSSDFEIDHISIENCSISGIYVKSDPDCSFQATRSNFTQFNTSIHDNYIAHVGNEGMYIGSSSYSGMPLTCNGKDTIVLPPLLYGVRIFNNIISYSGWDGIQVSSAPNDCQIFGNTISYDSQGEVSGQMTGILMGGGSKCDCYNNLVSNGKGDGIENHGLGSNKIFNNIIVNAGRTYLPNDPTQMKHGIFVSDVSVLKDSSFYIYFNDIINPKSDGIRFQSIKSKNNLITSNLIVNPGNFDYYTISNTSFSGKDAYIMVPNSASDIQIKNNYFTRTIQEAGISPNDYTVLPGSPLINAAYAGNPTISFDFRNHRRPAGGLYDIGAMEFDSGVDTLLNVFNQKLQLFPNPVNSSLTLRYLSYDTSITTILIYRLSGEQVIQQSNQVSFPGVQESQVIVGQLARGIYICAVRNGKDITYGKFIKL